MRIEVVGKSHVGMKRNINEDSFLVMPEQRLYCVADGMGGHFAGEIASKIAIDELAEFFRLTSTDRDVTWPFKMDKNRNYDENRLATGIKLANARIYEAASGDPNYRGMGTTIARSTSRRLPSMWVTSATAGCIGSGTAPWSW
jgi:protein phosphatase